EFAIVVPERILDQVRTYGDLVQATGLLIRTRCEEEAGGAERPLRMWVRITPPAGGSAGTLDRTGWLTPYTAETVAQDALRARDARPSFPRRSRLLAQATATKPQSPRKGAGECHGQEDLRREPIIFDHQRGARVAVRAGGDVRVGHGRHRPRHRPFAWLRVRRDELGE